MFSGPSSASGIKWESHHGCLLLVEPIELEHGIETTYGEKDAVRADVTVIDAVDGPEVYNDALIFPGVLISQTKRQIGKKVLGRLGQGAAKKGQQPPWRLDEYSEEDAKFAQEYVENRDKPVQPAQTAAAPF